MSFYLHSVMKKKKEKKNSGHSNLYHTTYTRKIHEISFKN